jgi:hypothetical protein
VLEIEEGVCYNKYISTQSVSAGCNCFYFVNNFYAGEPISFDRTFPAFPGFLAFLSFGLLALGKNLQSQIELQTPKKIEFGGFF